MHLHKLEGRVKTAVAETPAQVIADIGGRLRRTHSPAELRALADAARRRFLAARARLAAAGPDAPDEVVHDFRLAAALAAACVFALDPAGRLEQARAVLASTTAPHAG